MSSLRSTLLQACEDILRELQPNIWDTRGQDALRLYVKRFELEGRMEAESLTVSEVWRDAILEEKLVNSARYKAYVANGGMYKPDVDSVKAEEAGSEQASDFVLSGHVVGENISLQTVVGQVYTTTEHILSFTKFQQDVLRDTLTVYPNQYRKKHLDNVTYWVSRLVKIEKTETDETLPKNILVDYLQEFFAESEESPERHERALRLKNGAILLDGFYTFQLDTLLNLLKRYDRDTDWTRSKLKSYLKTLYGNKLQTRRLFSDYRCFTLPESLFATTDQPQILDDGGSRQDDPAAG